MGFSDWFKRRQSSEPPRDLREAIIALMACKDYQALVPLINENSQTIRESFPAWIKVPEAVRNQPEKMAAYVQTMFMLATMFERGGDPSLMVRLKGDGLTERWDASIATAQTTLDEGRASDAVVQLQQVLAEMADMTGSLVDHYRPRVLGRLGIALFKAGNRSEAITVTRKALELCREAADDEGVRSYEQNLNTMGTLDLPATDGSGSTMTIRDDKGAVLTAEEFAVASSGTLTWQVRGGADIPAEATRLHEEGRAAGERGDHDAALALFSKAAALAPEWPYPVYDRAYTHLLKNNAAAALADYQKTLELAPRGFFTAALSVDMLTREAAGEFPTGLYYAYTRLEWMPKEKQRSILSQLVEKHPSFAAAWNEYANFEPDAQKRLYALERGLAAAGDADTRGALSVKRALILAELGHRDQAVMQLQRIAADDTGSASAQAMAKAMLLPVSVAPGTA